MLDFSVTFFITIINILVLYVLLRKILFKPVSKFMADRSKKIADTIDQAEKDKREAKLLLEQYQKQLAGAEAEAEEIIRTARAAGEEEAERIRAEAVSCAERSAAAARSKTEAERAAALALFRAEAAALVTAAAGRLLKRELAGAEQLRYAAEALRELERDVSP
ncbi:MAG: F0F1 ATP synthase subunit B [Treponema sp.]|jgi:F-type H+-transporting ATPase subunit b|nr:F0F1 ATP synthase subunit B [Treponema sp.]